MSDQFIFTSIFFPPTIFILFFNLLIKLWLARFFAKDRLASQAYKVLSPGPLVLPPTTA